MPLHIIILPANIGDERNEDYLHIVYSQSKHINYVRAAGRVAQVLNEISPDDIKLSS